MKATVRNGQLHLLFNALLHMARTGRRGRSKQEVVDHYSIPVKRLPRNAPTIYRLNGDYILADQREMVMMCRHRLVDIIHWLEGVRSVCEVGCGTGQNLQLLHDHVPGKTYCGFDISPYAVEMSQAAGLNVDCADAANLPPPANSYDLVFTFAALEQMQANIDQVLAEIHRVARRYVVFYEPFADVNTRLERSYLWAKNYFRMPSHRLKSYGFMPVTTITDVPQKSSFGYCFVVCEVAA